MMKSQSLKTNTHEDGDDDELMREDKSVNSIMNNCRL